MRRPVPPGCCATRRLRGQANGASARDECSERQALHVRDLGTISRDTGFRRFRIIVDTAASGNGAPTPSNRHSLGTHRVGWVRCRRQPTSPQAGSTIERAGLLRGREVISYPLQIECPRTAEISELSPKLVDKRGTLDDGFPLYRRRSINLQRIPSTFTPNPLSLTVAAHVDRNTVGSTIRRTLLNFGQPVCPSRRNQ